MKLEHRSQQVVPFGRFIIRVARYALFSAVLIIISVGIGMVGYHHAGQLEWIDSFYMSCMVLAGMGEVEDMVSNGGKLFSSFYALYSGIAFMSITAVFFAPFIHRLLHILHVESEN